LIAHFFLSDFDFVEFCENYDHYASLIPDVTDGGYKLPGMTKVIKMIHDDGSAVDLMRQKWKGRSDLGRGLTKIFCWSAGHFLEQHSEEERKKLIDRFNKIDAYTIFLSDIDENYNIGTKHFVRHVPEWAGKPHDQHTGPMGQLPWHPTGVEGGVTPKIFKSIIDQHILRSL
jgi:hypothetical protein